MRILSVAEPDPDLVLEASGEDRAEGVHLSDILKRVMFERDRKFNPETPLNMVDIDRGFTWERIISDALSRRTKRPGYRPEQFQDDEHGIWMSPDWVNEDADIQLEEWKSTKASKKHKFEEKHWYWLPQTMAYLRGLLRRGVVKRIAVRFRIWYVNGDYTYESKASEMHLLRDYRRVDVEFDKREIEENWRMLVGYGQKYGLIKDRTWQKTRTETATATKSKKAGKAQRPSPETQPVRILPFTKKSLKHRSAS